MPLLCRLLGCLLALFAATALAQDETLYEGEVDVPSQSEAAREAALPQALAAVLVKLTGRADAGEDPVIAPSLSRAPELLRQYRYRQDLDPAQPGSARTVLVARFDRDGIEALLALAGQRIWPSPRPVPVVWLAIDDGRGPRLLGSAQASVVASLTARAAQRGLRLSYPLLDLQEQQQIAVGPFWAGDSAAARQASSRYQTRVALVGKLFRSPSGWTTEWALYDGETRLGETTRSAPDAMSVLRDGADLAADLLSAQATVAVVEAGPAGSYPVRIAGLMSAEDYGRALAYLRSLSVVQTVRVLGAVDDQLRLEVQLRTGLPGLRQLVASGQTLVAEDEDSGEGRFRLLP